MHTNIKEIQWTNSIPIFKNSTILKQLGIAVGLPFGFVIAFILISSGWSKDSLYAASFIIEALLLAYLLIKVVCGGKYEAEFTIDEKGIYCCSEEKQASKNRLLNKLTVLAGIFSGKPAVSGAGLLAQSKNRMFIPWTNISKIKYIEKEFVILIYGGFAEKIALFCTGDNYSEIEKNIKGKSNV
jgi:hypothetical protein